VRFTHPLRASPLRAGGTDPVRGSPRSAGEPLASAISSRREHTPQALRQPKAHCTRPRHPPQRAPPLHPPHAQQPLHTNAPYTHALHTPLPTTKTPARLLTQPKTALHPTKPHRHRPTPPQLQHQHPQRHRQLPTTHPIQHCVNPKRHRRARLASLGALGMPAHNNQEKHPLAPPHPTTRTHHPHQQPHRTPPHYKRHPSPPRVPLPLVLRRPHWGATHPPTPPT
jgi:hypothetical protein